MSHQSAIESLKLDEFSAWLAAKGKTPGTIQAILADIDALVRKYARGHEDRIQPAWVDDELARHYLNYLFEISVKPRTINRRLAALTAYSDWAQQAGYGNPHRTPVEKIRPVPEVPIGPRWLSPEEVQGLKLTLQALVRNAKLYSPEDHLDALRARAMLLLALGAGLRGREVVGLQLADFQFKTRGGRLVVRQPNDGVSREVNFSQSVQRALEAYLQARPETDDPTLFLSSNLAALPRWEMQQEMKWIAWETEIYDLGWQVLRNTYARSLVDKGVNLEQLAARLGHARVNDARIYFTFGAPNGADRLHSVYLSGKYSIWWPLETGASAGKME